MSRPYININTMGYTSSVLSMNYAYYKLRSANPVSRTLTVTGFSSSFTFSITHDSVDYSSGRTADTLTFSVGNLGTSSTTTYIPASITYNFSGTASTASNVIFTLQGLTLSSATATGTTLSTFLNSIVNGFSYTGVNAGFTASVSGNSIVFSAPSTTGTYFNNIAINAKGSAPAGLGATLTYSVANQSTTYSVAGTFSGGTNIQTAVITYSDLGYSDSVVFNVTGTNL